MGRTYKTERWQRYVMEDKEICLERLDTVSWCESHTHPTTLQLLFSPAVDDTFSLPFSCKYQGYRKVLMNC